MQLTLPDITAPVTLILDPSQKMSDEAYYEFCSANPDVNFERTPQGEIIIVPPAGGDSDYSSLDAGAQLKAWSKKDGRGKALGSSVQFMLPSGAGYSPDAAWVSNERLSKLSREQLRVFPPVCPNFVIEVMSPSDRLKRAQKKMLAWLADGVELGWLIDIDHQTVYVYRAGSLSPEIFTGIKTLAGEGPVAGFELDLTDIWAGL